MLQLWWTCTVELKVSAVVFWQAVLSHDVRSYVWVLMTCLNHSLPLHTSLCFQDEINSRKYSRRSGSAKIIQSNRPAALHFNCREVWRGWGAEGFTCLIPRLHTHHDVLTPSPFWPLSDKSLWLCLRAPRTAGDQRGRSHLSISPPPSPVSLPSLTSQCKHIIDLLLTHLKNAPSCQKHLITTHNDFCKGCSTFLLICRSKDV